MEKPEFIKNCEIVWAKIHLKGCKELFISTFYMNYRNIPDLEALDASLDLVNEKGNRHLILCGDFNCPNIDWKTHTVIDGINGNPAQDRPVQEKLIDLTQSHSLTQLQEEATRHHDRSMTRAEVTKFALFVHYYKHDIRFNFRFTYFCTL